MTTTIAQQVVLDNALVPLENRVEIGIFNLRIDLVKTQKEPTYHVFLDALALTTCYPAFLITADELGHKGDIKSVSDAVVDQMYQPWRTFSSIINKCLSGKIIDFTFQIENRDTKKQEKMYYPRFIKAIIHHFITKDKSISMRNRMFMHTAEDDSILGLMRFVSKSEDFQVYGALLPEVMTNQKMQNSHAYKTYLAYATRATTPKKARKFKKPASPLKKKSLNLLRKLYLPRSLLQNSLLGVQIRDTPSEAALLEDSQVKKVLRRSRREQQSIKQVAQVMELVLHQGFLISLKASLDDKDVLKSDDYLEQADDEWTEFDNPRTNVEEYERINEELYGDVNVRLTDDEPADEEKDDEEMTVAGHKTEVPLPSSSISSDYAAKFLNFDNIPSADTKVVSIHNCLSNNNFFPLSSLFPSLQKSTPIPTPTTTEATTSTTIVPDSETLNAIRQRITDLEKDVKELKDVDKSTKVISTIKSEVPNAVKEYLA
ncbi:hypothetical protein Tco_0446163 [Tanacetum coccineum]